MVTRSIPTRPGVAAVLAILAWIGAYALAGILILGSVAVVATIGLNVAMDLLLHR